MFLTCLRLSLTSLIMMRDVEQRRSGKQHLGGLSVEEADDRKEAALKELSLR